jgi:protease II
MYFVSGMNDQRVSFHEPLKFLAKLRAKNNKTTKKWVIRIE